jgi:hypothetical protein
VYLDEDAMGRSLVFGLKARGIDVITATEAGMVNREDNDQLIAAVLDRAIYTYNIADYCTLHQRWIGQDRHHAGIIVAQQQRLPIGDEIRRIARLVGAVSRETMRGRLEFLSNW